MDARLDRPLQGGIPWGLVATTVALAGVGIYNLVSASRPPHAPVWTSQTLYLGVGLLAMLAVSLLSPRVLYRAALPFYLLNLAALVALRFVGHRAKGAESWFVLGPLRVQPAEFMKLALLLMLARYFHDDFKAQQPGYGVLRLTPPAVIALVPTALVLAQPDLGTALMLAFTALTLLLFSGPRWTTLLLLAVGALAAGGVVWNDYLRPQPEPRFTLVRHQLKKHQDQRIAGWLDPTLDVKGTNYHARQSLIAVGSGGLDGKGWLNGTQTGLRFLPEQHTDFIFSVFAEEQGLVRSLALLALYGALLAFVLGVAYGAQERFGAFLAVGVASMLFWQVFENIGMVTGVLPITGITLPFMSYGGSSLLSVMMGIGLVVSVNRGGALRQ